MGEVAALVLFIISEDLVTRLTWTSGPDRCGFISTEGANGISKVQGGSDFDISYIQYANRAAGGAAACTSQMSSDGCSEFLVCRLTCKP